MKLRIELNMPIEMAEERLNQHMNSEHHLWPLLIKSGVLIFWSKTGMFGKIQAHRLWLACIHSTENYPRRCFFARFFEQDGLTILQGEFRFSVWSIAGNIFQLILLLLIGGALFGDWPFWISAGLKIGGLYIAGIFLIGLYRNRHYDSETETFLLELYASELRNSAIK